MTDKMREEFEKWGKNYKHGIDLRVDPDNRYISVFTEDAYIGFQAAYNLRAQEVDNLKQINLELAEFMFCCSSDGSDIDGGDAQSKLEALGFIELVTDPDSEYGVEPFWQWIKGSQVSTINKLLLRISAQEQEVRRLRGALVVAKDFISEVKIARTSDAHNNIINLKSDATDILIKLETTNKG